MEYYAAALREQGAVKINTDGIMIKGCLLNREKIVVMAFCHTESVKDCKHQRSGLFENLSSQKEAERSDLIIRFLEAGTEELMAGYETACDFDGKRKCIELFQSFMELFEGVAAKKRLIRGKTITLIIICGQKMQVLSNTKKDIYVIKSEGLSKQREYERIDLSREIFMIRGYIAEYQTIVIGSDTLFERLSDRELVMNLCPQMCRDSDTMEYILGCISENIRGKGMMEPYCGGAVCIK